MAFSENDIARRRTELQHAPNSDNFKYQKPDVTAPARHGSINSPTRSTGGSTTGKASGEYTEERIARRRSDLQHGGSDRFAYQRPDFSGFSAPKPASSPIYSPDGAFFPKRNPYEGVTTRRPNPLENIPYSDPLTRAFSQQTGWRDPKAQALYELAERVQAQRDQNNRKNFAASDPIGRMGAGNIDLYNRPQYRQPDGSLSTVNSISIGTDDGEVLIPTIGRDAKGNPVQWTDDEAIENYYRTGEHLGKFRTPEEADRYAEMLHNQQEAYYSTPQQPKITPASTFRSGPLADIGTGPRSRSAEAARQASEAARDALDQAAAGVRFNRTEAEKRRRSNAISFPETETADDEYSGKMEQRPEWLGGQSVGEYMRDFMNSQEALGTYGADVVREYNRIYDSQGAGAAQEYVMSKGSTGNPGMERIDAFLTGVGNASGINSIAGIAMGPENYRRVASEQQSISKAHPIASAAGSITGTLPLITTLGRFARAIPAVAGLSKAAQAVISGAAAMGGSTAIQEAGAAANGLISPGRFVGDVAVSGLAGIAGGALGNTVSQKGMQFLYNSGLINNSIARTVVAGLSGSGYSVGSTGVREASEFIRDPENYEADPVRIIKDASVAFAFGAISYIANGGTRFTMNEEASNERPTSKWFEDCSTPQEVDAKLRQYARQYHPDQPTGDADLFSEISAEATAQKAWMNVNAGAQAYQKAQEAYSAGNADAYQEAKAEYEAAVNALVVDVQSGAIQGQEAVEAIQVLQAVSENLAGSASEVPGGAALLSGPVGELADSNAAVAVPQDVSTPATASAIRDIPGNPYSSMTADQRLAMVAREMMAPANRPESEANAGVGVETPSTVSSTSNTLPSTASSTGKAISMAQHPANAPSRAITLEDIARSAVEQKFDTKDAQRQAIVDVAQNLDHENLAAAMENATMLTEAEKQAAFREGVGNAAIEMGEENRNVAGEPGGYLSGEGSGRPVSLGAGEPVGGVRTQAGRVAEGWQNWTAAADTGIKGSPVALKRGVPAEEIIRTAEPGQVIYQVESGHTPSMRKAAAMVRAYDPKIEVVPFVSGNDIRVISGEAARAFVDPKRRSIGYRANDERATSDQLARHELIELGVIDGKVDTADALRHLDAGLKELIQEDVLSDIANAYMIGSGKDTASLSPAGLKRAIQHANKEMICDIGAGINQFKGLDGFEALSDAVDIAHDILHDYINEKLGGAFEAEYDETTAPAATAETAAGTGTEATAPSRIVGESPKVEITDKNVSVDSIVPTITEMPKNLPEYSSTLYREPAQKELFTLSKDGKISIKEKLNMSGRDFLIKQMKEKGYRDKKNTLAWLDKTADFMDKAEAVYTYIGLDDIKNTKIVIDPRSGNIVLRALVKNGEYPVNIDLTKECTRRIALGKFVDWLSRNAGRKGGKTMLEEVPLTASNLVLFNKILKDEGFDTACLGCFVETRRYRIQEWADSFIEKYNKAVEKSNPGAGYFNFADKDVYVSDLSKKDLADLNEALESYKASVKEERSAKKAFAKAEKERLKSIGATKKQIDSVKSDLTNEEQINALVRSNKIYQKKLRVSDLITPGGRTVLHRDFPELESLVLGHYGSNTPKSVELFTPYNYDLGSILSVGSQTLRDYVKPIGGAREQSFSDSVPTHLMDQMEKTADMAVNKLPDHIYTKIPSEVLLFGLTKRKFNMSIMFNIDPNVDSAHAGLRADGSYFVGDRKTSELEARAGRERTFVQSFPYDMARKIQHMPGYSENCGMIGVGYSYFHIRKMLADPEFGYIIGYHPSGMNGELASASHIDKATSYEPVQNTLKINGLRHVTGELDGLPSYASWPQGIKTTDNKMIEKTKLTMKDFDMKGNLKKYGGKETMRRFLAWLEENRLTVDTSKASYKGVEQHGVGSFPLYEDLARTKDYRKTADNYITWCLENDMLPEFFEFADDDNYFNFIYDFTTYDHNTGKYSPQLPVQMNFPDNFFKLASHSLNQWNNYMMRQDPKEIPTFERMYNEAAQQLHYSSKLDLSGNKDSDGNNLTVGQEEYFKDSKVRDKDGNLKVMYHGTERGGFTVFDPAESDDGISLFFTDYSENAREYSGSYDEITPDRRMSESELRNMIEKITEGDFQLSKVENGYSIDEYVYDDSAYKSKKTFKTLKEAQAYAYEEFVKEGRYGGYGTVPGNYEVYLNLKDPLVIDAQGSYWNEIPYWENEDGELDPATTREIAEDAKEMGYDGVIINNVWDNGQYTERQGVEANIAIAFSSNQVKSVYNENPTENEDIRYSSKLNLGPKFTDYDENVEKAGMNVSYSLSDDGKRIAISPESYMNDATWKKVHNAINRLGYGMPSVEITKQYVLGGYNLQPDQTEALKKIFGISNGESAAETDIKAAKATASKAARQFGVTRDLKKAAYLTVNGTMLDFSEGQRTRMLDHRAISQILDLPEGHGYSDGMIEFMNQGNIRLQSYGIDISKEPNQAQRRVLRQIIEDLDGKFVLDISNEKGDTVASVEYSEGTRTAKILADIDRYFKEGTIPEQNSVSQFHMAYSSKLNLKKSQEQDEEYNAAVKANDTETAARLVKEAAEAAGYTENIYHGTGAFGFTKFDLGKMDDGASIFATTDSRVAESYSGETKRELISQRAGESADAIIDRIDGAKDEDLLPLIKENLDSKYERVPQERLAEMRDERVNDIRFYADKIMDFMDDNPGMFDEAKSIAASRLASSMYKLSRAQSADEVDEYLRQYNDDAWELKFMDEDAFYEIFDGGNGITTTNNAIRELNTLLEFDVMFTNGERKPGSTLDVLTPGEARTLLIGEMSKGIYHLYGKKENMLEFDANGDNWNMIDTARISNKAFRIKSASSKDKAWLSGLYMPFNDAQSLAARATRDVNGEDDYLDVKDLRDPLGRISGWEFRSHKTGEMVMELESALPSRAMTRDIAKYAREVGYDGVIMRNLKDSGGATAYNHPSDVYIYFKPNAVKSADTVTYDDGGNAIPLSERFKTGEDDIRYSSKLDLRRKQERDNEYMDAVNTGDIAKAAKMVSKAAEEAGFKNAIPEQTLAYKVRTGKAPQKTMKVYKVFTVAPDGSPTALFVSGTQKLPQGVWLDAQDTWHFTAANGEQYVPSTQNPYTEGGKTGGSVEIPSEEIRQELIRRGFLPEGSKAKKVTALAYRPGWHAGDLPFFPQGGMQDKAYAEKETEYGDIWKQIRKEEGVSENKAKRLRRERYGTFDEWRGSENVAAHPYKNIHRYNQVVFECEIAFDHDYTRSEVIKKNGENKGKVQFFDMQEMPVDGGYKFATNPMANANDIGSWYISGSLKIGRALTQEECDAILKENGRTPQFWEQGDMDLESLGYTGQQYEAARKTLAPVTYDDDGNVIPLSKRFDPEVDDVRYSSKLNLPDTAPTFYSKLQREIEGFKGNKIGAASVESYLKGKGVKDEEIKWSGIRTYLEGKKSVGKAELMQYLKANEVRIEEKVLDDKDVNTDIWSNGYSTVNINHFYDPVRGTEFTDEEGFREEANKRFADDGFDQWGSEIVFNISDDYMSAETEDGFLILEAYPPDPYELRDSDFEPSTNTHWGDYKLSGGENYREIMFKLPGSDYVNDAMRVHWKGEKGVLVHARVQDFKTESGEKVLFVEEIQSDWHNAGQKATTLDKSHIETVKAASGKNLYLLKDNKSNEELGRATQNEVEGKNIKDVHGYLVDKLSVPDAPYRTTYTDYVLKNLLRMAAEGDYDYLAWTTGKMQEERWSGQYAEGYRIEYDQQIPKFLKKYGKQWGAGLTDVSVAGNEVPAIVVNDAMKESVLTEGQPMFSTKLKLDGKEIELTEREEKLMEQLNEGYLKRIEQVTVEKDAQIEKLKEQMKAAVGAEKQKAREQIAKIRKEKNERIAYLEKQWRQNTNWQIAELKKKAEAKRGEEHDDMIRRLAKLQAEKDQKIEDILANHRRQRQEARDRRNDRKLRVKFQKLARKALRESQNKPGLASERVQELLKDIDLTALGMRDDTRTSLHNKLLEIMEMRKTDENYLALHAEQDWKKVERLFKKQIKDMSLEEVNDLITELSALCHYQETTDRLIKDEQNRTAAEVGRQIVKDLKELTPLDITNPVKVLSAKYLRDNLSPDRAFNRLSGYKRDSAMRSLYRQVLDGYTKVKEFEKKSDELFDGFRNDPKNKEFLKNGAKQTIPVTSKYGQTALISPAMRVSLYMASRNRDNIRHISTDGMTIPEPKAYAKGLIEDAYGRGTTIVLDPVDVNKVCANMTESEKEFASLLETFFDGYAKEAINDTSVELDGILKAIVDHYFPIASDKNFLAKSMDSFQDPTLEGWNNLKARQENANNKILLEDARQVLQRHIRNTARYYGLAIPMRNWNKVYGYTSHRDEDTGTRNSVQSAIKNAWNSDTADYIERLIRDDINSGGRKAERGVMDSMRSAYAGATLTLNAGVALKQTTSYFMAGSILDMESLMYGLSHKFKKTDQEYMDSITPWGWARRQGESTIELGEMARRRDPITRNTPNWNQAMDVITTNALFTAAERSIQKDYPDLKRGDKKYDDALAERYNQVLWRTQPQYESAFRPEYLRKTDIGSRTFGMFKTESMQMSGELIDAWGQWKADEKRAKSGGEQEKRWKSESSKQFYKTFASWLASNMCFAMMGTALDIVMFHKGRPYRNERGEVDLQTIAAKTGANFVGSALGGYFFASTAFSLGSYLFNIISGEKATWYDIEVPGISLINDMVTNTGNWVGTMIDEEASPSAKAKATSKFVLSASKFTPLGFAGNLLKLADSLNLYIQDIREGIKTGDWHLYEAGDGFLQDTSPTKDQYANQAVYYAGQGNAERAGRALKRTKTGNLEKALGRKIGDVMFSRFTENPQDLVSYMETISKNGGTPKLSDVPDRGFSSFTKLKEGLGSPNRNENWHHIVEQQQGPGDNNFGTFSSTQINNANNVISIPSGAGSVHKAITDYYTSVQDFTDGMTVREWLAENKTFEEQFDFGIEQLRKYGEVAPTERGWVFIPNEEKINAIPLKEGKDEELTATQKQWDTMMAEAREDGGLTDREIRAAALQMLNEGVPKDEVIELYKSKKNDKYIDEWMKYDGESGGDLSVYFGFMNAKSLGNQDGAAEYLNESGLSDDDKWALWELVNWSEASYDKKVE